MPLTLLWKSKNKRFTANTKVFHGLDVLGNGWSFVGFFYKFLLLLLLLHLCTLEYQLYGAPGLLIFPLFFYLATFTSHNCLSCISHLLFLKIIDCYCLLSNIALLLSCANFAQFYIKWLIISLVISVINLFLI